MKPSTILCAAAVLALCGCATVPPTPGADHEAMLVLDTHLDTPVHFARPGWHFGDRHDLATDLAQVDMPRMREGGLDGGFFAIFTEQGPLDPAGYAAALAFARERSNEIDRTIASSAAQIAPATTAADALRLWHAHKLIAFKSIENSYPLGSDLSHLREFYDRGVRLAGPVHGKNNQFADSSTDQPKWHGLSPLGRDWVREMNRLGMVIDASHASDDTLEQMLALSSTPILLSHTTARAAFDHPRNLDDAHIRKLASKGGAICLSTIYLSPIHLEGERGILYDRSEHLSEMTTGAQADVARRWRALDATQRFWDADFESFMKMTLHVIAVAGVDHVCFGADWDGGGGIAGLEDITHLPRITERLKQVGYSAVDIEKMWSGNVLRVLQQAQDARSAK
jgi:membrane dipeptidase